MLIALGSISVFNVASAACHYGTTMLNELLFLIIFASGTNFWLGKENLLFMGFPTVYDTTTFNEHPFLFILVSGPIFGWNRTWVRLVSFWRGLIEIFFP